MADYQIIDDEGALVKLVPELLAEPAVAFDSEADSFYHYKEKLCLLQVAIPSRPNFAYLIDPLAMGGPAKLAPLAPVFASNDIRIIFHAAEYDLFLLKHDCGFSVENLFDTMISAQLLGYPSIGLAALVERHFDVTLEKDEQRSDWSVRPLSEEQLCYAAADVYYLVELVEKLEVELEESGRRTWADEEFRALCERERPERAFDEEGYLRLKGARSLAPPNLSVLRELFLFREAYAEQLDRPPFMVLGPRTLMALAEGVPSNRSQLAKIRGVGERTVRKLGVQLLEAIEKGRAHPHDPPPKSPKRNGGGPRRIDRSIEPLFNALKSWRATRSRELNLDPGVFCPNASLEAIAMSNPSRQEDLSETPLLKQWFLREFGNEVLDVLGEEKKAPDNK